MSQVQEDAVPGVEAFASTAARAPRSEQVERCIDQATRWLFDRQKGEGYWVAEFEADSTLESYFILIKAFMGKLDDPKIPKYVRRLRSTMLPDGGWPNYLHGAPDLSVSVLTYFALKVGGVPASDPDMTRSREVILRMGGAPKANTYTKYQLAYFGQYDWAHVPAVPPEMIFLPTVSPVNIYSLSSWSRAIFVPLSIVYALKPVRPLPPERGVDELFPGGREKADVALPRVGGAVSWNTFFLLTDLALKVAEKFPIQAARRRAIEKARQWMVERFRCSGGLGAILPAMMNSLLALQCLGYASDDPLFVEAVKELDGLEIERPESGSIQVQPCHSPVWDTAISLYALSQSDKIKQHPALRKAARWLLTKEVKTAGDWKLKNPVPPSGWYFEFENEYYPDVDDTIMVMMALRGTFPRGSDRAVDAALERALTWVLGMQNKDGGWASFDRDNDMEFLTKIPFADFNALIDPSTADITSRVLEMFGMVAPERFSLSHPVVRKALRFIKDDQCDDGSWYGRWGVNYLYGTWQVLRGLRIVGEDMSLPYVRRAVAWLRSVQQPDGGWGERADTYEFPDRKGRGPSTYSQTAWAVMGLLAAGEGHSDSLQRGVRFLLDGQTDVGSWEEDEWTGTGFPRVFYMKYHYYRHYWPLMALLQYQRFARGYRP